MIKKIAFVLFIFLSLFAKAQDLILVNSNFGDSLTAPAVLNIEAQSIDYNPGEPAYLHIINTESGYRKLKLGNNPNTIYSPKVNVIAGGNTTVKITLRDVSKSVDWSKIRFRPSSIGSLNLKPYVDLIGGIDDHWKTISIPLSDFDSSIDFSQVALIEFPYSADAAPFELDVAKIEFIGGNTPYIWYGDTKTDNIHDGFGGAGQLIASSVEAIEAENTLESIEIYLNDTLVNSTNTYPFVFDLTLTELGENTIYSIARFIDGSSKRSDNYSVFLKEFIPLDLSISLSSPKTNDTVTLHNAFKIHADILGATPSQTAYLSVVNQSSGYLKLKLGYDPVNIYAPGKNVIAGGNNKLLITLKNESGFSNWSKLRLRPKSLGSLNLQSYVDAVGGITNEWKTIEIPLSDFDSSIDFSNLNYFEFPYSADAGPFQLAIKEIIFSGGDQDFKWFGEEKTDNSHDGLGGAGQLVAQIVPAQSSENSIQSVEFYIDNQLIATDTYFPYETEYIPDEEGEHSASAKVITQNQQTASSTNIKFLAIAPENPVSDLKITFLKPNTGDSALVNQTINFIPFIDGEDLETDIYLKTWNTETGYRKLKFGYDNNSIYGQFQDVIAGGNDTLEIVLKSFTSQTNWSRIRIRPSSLGVLTLDKYISTETQDWTTIKIPLNDFDSAIDFTNLSYIEFPYSADAGAFELGIKSVRFIGGITPFEWFGPSHYNNAHDGTGESGRIFAQLQLPNPNPIKADTVFFIVNGIQENYSTTAPFLFNYSSSTETLKTFQLKLVDSYGYKAVSSPIELNFYDFHSEDFSALTLTFDQDPGDVHITLAPLKYNKDFAYSIILDDGKEDGYSYAFKLLNGGTVSETNESFDGFFFSDGCENSIPFRAGIAWNSVNSAFYDIHINTPDYITWPQLQEMIAADWEVLNHSYSHAAYGDTDYSYQITENQHTVFEHTAYEMTHFVIPSGDLNYVAPAFTSGMQAVYSNKFDFLGYGTGIDIDSPFHTENLKIYRRYMNDDLYNTSNIMDKINEIAEQSQNGNHFWWLDFTHRIIPTPTGGSLVWNTFKYYMQKIADTYGKNGSDRIWFAPPEDILNYLKTRENTGLSFEKKDNIVTVYLNTSQIPTTIDNYFLSLNVSANAQLLSVSPQFSANTSFANSTTTNKLINIQWSQTTMKRMKAVASTNLNVEKIEEGNIDVYPNPLIGNNLFVNFYAENKEEYTLKLYSNIGQEIVSQINTSKKGLNTFELKIPNLNSGIYYLKINNQKKLIATEKIIVQ